VTDAGQVRPDQPLQARLAEGRIEVVVTGTAPGAPTKGPTKEKDR
jgi:hypothetical protein